METRKDYYFKNNIVLLAIAAPVLVFALALFPACKKEKAETMKKTAVPVTVATAEKRSVPMQIFAVGNSQAYETVAVKARVGGELKRVYFREGQDVSKGDLLFTIDPQPFETALEAAQASVAKNTALVKKAEDDLSRYTELLREELVSREQYENVRTNVDALRAVLRADKAFLENARLQLSYCSIYAPVSGRTGSLLVDKGNLVKANDERPLILINKIQPIYVDFSVPEKNLSEIKRRMKSGTLPVEAYLSGDDREPAKGSLTFMDNTVNAATGTIRLRAAFENKERLLWPGQFVNVRITLATIQDAVTVPLQAVQTGQQGQFIFVVSGETAELRPISAGIISGDVMVIEKGVNPGEQVVTDGQMRLMPGARVEILKQPKTVSGTPSAVAQGASPQPSGADNMQKGKSSP